jgi:hypothetical protein
MNPAYHRVRFKAELPEGGLPVRFGIVTACNPDGHAASDAENAAATETFRAQLIGARAQQNPNTHLTEVALTEYYILKRKPTASN